MAKQEQDTLELLAGPLDGLDNVKPSRPVPLLGFLRVDDPEGRGDSHYYCNLGSTGFAEYAFTLSVKLVTDQPAVVGQMIAFIARLPLFKVTAIHHDSAERAHFLREVDHLNSRLKVGHAEGLRRCYEGMPEWMRARLPKTLPNLWKHLTDNKQNGQTETT